MACGQQQLAGVPTPGGPHDGFLGEQPQKGRPGRTVQFLQQVRGDVQAQQAAATGGYYQSHHVFRAGRHPAECPPWPQLQQGDRAAGVARPRCQLQDGSSLEPAAMSITAQQGQSRGGGGTTQPHQLDRIVHLPSQLLGKEVGQGLGLRRCAFPAEIGDPSHGAEHHQLGFRLHRNDTTERWRLAGEGRWLLQMESGHGEGRRQT